MLSFKQFLLFLAIVPTTLAVDCTSSNAVAWPKPANNSGEGSSSGSGGGSGGGRGSDSTVNDPCPRLCRSNPSCLDLCYGRDTPIGKKLKARAIPLSCSASETCFMFIDNSLLCLDTATGSFHDEEGTKGNVISGVMTAADGRVTTILPAPTTGSTQGTAASTSSASITRDTAASNPSATITSAMTRSTSAPAPAATTTSRSGAQRLNGFDVLVGGLGSVMLQALL